MTDQYDGAKAADATKMLQQARIVASAGFDYFSAMPHFDAIFFFGITPILRHSASLPPPCTKLPFLLAIVLSTLEIVFDYTSALYR